MNGAGSQVLALNCGSSSIKFALYRAEEPLRPRFGGKVDRIGVEGTRLSVRDPVDQQPETRTLGDVGHGSAADLLIDWLDQRVGLDSIAATGHRVAHGGTRFSEPQRVTDELVEELRRICVFAPEHLPAEIAMIERLRARAPRQTQVVCFDTAFHRDLPRVARLLPLPRRLLSKGIERYGFHGLSYAFLIGELARVAGVEAARQRVILAHLGNGASLAAVRDGRSVDTSMGFTPAAGLPMSNRSGDLDPGLVFFLAQTEAMTAEAFHDMVNHRSGLLGISEVSSDVRDLLACEAHDVRAAEALALFCYQVRKWIGAFAAALGGLDTLVFAGGIGENAPAIRARICEDLTFLGIAIDSTRNQASEPVISSAAGRTVVRVMRTDEELMIARATIHLLRTQPL